MNYKHIIDAMQNGPSELNWEDIYSDETWALHCNQDQSPRIYFNCYACFKIFENLSLTRAVGVKCLYLLVR